MPTIGAANAAGWFAAGNPATGIPYTVVSHDFLNILQAELLNILAAASVVPAKSQTSQVLQAIQLLTSIKMTGALNLYVSPTGSDSNNGLSSAAPFATMQHAWNTVVTGYNLGGFNVYINLMAGTHTVPLILWGYPIGVTGGQVVIQGASLGTPDQTVVNVTNANCFYLAQGCGSVIIQGLKMVASGTQGTFASQGNGIVASSPGNVVNVNAVDFGSCTNAHMFAGGAAVIVLPATGPSTIPYTISGGAAFHAYATEYSTISLQGGTITISNTPAFSGQFLSAANGQINWAYNTVTGTATGPRYLAALNAIINTNGGTTSVPGSTAGSVATQGQVL